LSYLSPMPWSSVNLSTSADESWLCCTTEYGYRRVERTGGDLLVGEALGLVVTLESVLGLVHESRHCGLSWWVVLRFGC
jgi:hypothetical protein